MAGSPKVTASAVGAASATVVTSILSAHLFHGAVPADVLGLVEAGITAAITYASGYLTKHVPAPIVADVEAAVKDLAGPLPLENPQPATAVLPPAGA